MSRLAWVGIGSLAPGFAFAFLCGCAIAAGRPIELRRPVEARLLQSTGFETSGELVVTDPETWRAAWSRLVAGRRPPPPLPAVDFNTELVVVVALGRVTSGGHSVRIVSAEPRGRGFVLIAEVLRPGKGCVTTSNVTAPADVVVLPRRAQPVVVDLRYATRDCE